MAILAIASFNNKSYTISVLVEWRHIYARLEDLQRAILKSMIPVLHPDGQVDELLMKNVFRV